MWYSDHSAMCALRLASARAPSDIRIARIARTGMVYQAVLRIDYGDFAILRDQYFGGGKVVGLRRALRRFADLYDALADCELVD